MKHAIIAIEDRRFYTNEGVDLRGIGRALYQDVVQQQRRAGRLDDHPAVRQERARGAGRADAVPEAARGRARLPPDAPVVEGADPQHLPEHDLLRQRRLRDRGGRAHVLPAQPPGLRRDRRHELRATSCCPHEAALLAGMVSSPTGYDPIAHPEAARSAPQPGAAADARAGLPHARAVRRATRRSRCRTRATCSRRPRKASTRTSPRGSSSRSSTASAAGRRAPAARSRAA